MKHLLAFAAIVIIATFLGSAQSAWASAAVPSGATDPEEARAEPTDNLCFGGLEDGKIIVGEAYLQNPYRETTRLGCEVDGGAPETMPDLPAPDAAKTRLA